MVHGIRQQRVVPAPARGKIYLTCMLNSNSLTANSESLVWAARLSCCCAVRSCKQPWREFSSPLPNREFRSQDSLNLPNLVGTKQCCDAHVGILRVFHNSCLVILKPRVLVAQMDEISKDKMLAESLVWSRCIFFALRSSMTGKLFGRSSCAFSFKCLVSKSVSRMYSVTAGPDLAFRGRPILLTTTLPCVQAQTVCLENLLTNQICRGQFFFSAIMARSA
jgi:hypothetical protein